MRKLTKVGLFLSVIGLLALTQPGYAIHFYRGSGAGCSPADGELTDDPLDDPEFVRGEITAEVQLWHNTFYDPEAPDMGSAGSSQNKIKNETRIKVGEAVKWTWNSAHCHSVENAAESVFSGFHYPTTAPDSPQVAPGAFHYPVLTDEPTLYFIHTFTQPGEYPYFCIHHNPIGMNGVVIVEE